MAPLRAVAFDIIEQIEQTPEDIAMAVHATRVGLMVDHDPKFFDDQAHRPLNGLTRKLLPHPVGNAVADEILEGMDTRFRLWTGRSIHEFLNKK